MSNKAVFPGSFDPFTLGHNSVIRKGLPLFDSITILVGQNSSKTSYFSAEKRLEWIRALYKSESKIKVEILDSLTVDYCIKNDCAFILRGLRNAQDFQYESSIAHMNQALQHSVETVFVLCDIKYAAISSSIVREIHKNGGDISQFLPSSIKINRI